MLDLAMNNIALDVQRNLSTENASLFARALRLDMPAVSEFAARAYDSDEPDMLFAIEFLKAAIELTAIPA
jgi:hypothetical protein